MEIFFSHIKTSLYKEPSSSSQLSGMGSVPTATAFTHTQAATRVFDSYRLS